MCTSTGALANTSCDPAVTVMPSKDSPASYTFTAVGQCACVELSGWDPATMTGSFWWVLEVDDGATTTTVAPGDTRGEQPENRF